MLGWDRDGRVVYSSRGSNPEKEFQNCHVRVTGTKFAQRAVGKLRQVEDPKACIVANKATPVVAR